MDNEILKTIKARRSVRKYIHEKQIDDETLRLILEAGTFAATGMGRQSPIIIAVQNQEDINIMRRLNAAIMGNPNSDPFYGAPTVVVVLADRSIGTPDRRRKSCNRKYDARGGIIRSFVLLDSPGKGNF